MTFATLDDFWPFYVSQHMKPWTRKLHFIGTTAGLLFLGQALLIGAPWLLLPGLVVSYGLAWVGHFYIEKNRPATFKYPLLSFRADFRMYALMWRGGMEKEIARLKPALKRYL